MTKGKRLACPRIVVVEAEELKYASRDEAWAAVGPILARILAQTIRQEKAEQKDDQEAET
ncbi:MAG: hypothetical protein JXM73_09635 [Anaerolineae bacterium]|nr:hypothetical protein [Anaerolineae bacterium]